jgi:hypothetical protein
MSVRRAGSPPTTRSLAAPPPGARAITPCPTYAAASVRSAGVDELSASVSSRVAVSVAGTYRTLGASAPSSPDARAVYTRSCAASVLTTRMPTRSRPPTRAANAPVAIGMRTAVSTAAPAGSVTRPRNRSGRNRPASTACVVSAPTVVSTSYASSVSGAAGTRARAGPKNVADVSMASRSVLLRTVVSGTESPPADGA